MRKRRDISPEKSLLRFLKIGIFEAICIGLSTPAISLFLPNLLLK